MVATYEDLTIEISDDDNFDPDSVDNAFEYKFVYGYGDGDDYRFVTKHAIKVIDGSETDVSGAIILGYGGATSIHDRSFIIVDNSVIICCGDQVYSLRLPDLTLSWNKKIDDVTCFGIHKFEDDLIIHGELEIFRVTLDGEIKWRSGGKDIFVSRHRKENFYILDGKIHAYDWDDTKYILDGDGNLIELIPPL